MREQEALLESYCSARKIRCDHWHYNQYQADLKAAYKEMDEAADEVCGKTNDKE